ncbi:MAG: NAD-dependent epimerase/dehydratase family protein [Thermoguttaceae bacterium]
MARILVTGASGFIGFHLTRALLDQGYEVSCLVRKSSKLDRLAGLPIRRVDGDVTDAESLRRVVPRHDAVYHLAGLAKAIYVQELYQVNCKSVANVAQTCAAQTTPPVLLVVSSLAAMGPSSAQRPRLESDAPVPVSHYGRSKLAGERAARQWANQVPITILRPPVVFGEADPATYEIFRPIARCGVHVVPGCQTNHVSLIHAGDLLQAMILAAQRGKRILCDPADAVQAAQGCYFVPAERDLTFAEMGRMMGEALGRRRTCVVRMGPICVWTFGLFATAMSRIRGQAWYFSLDKAREARAGSWTCSGEAAARELGFAVTASLDERFRQTAHWYQEHGWL